MVCLMFIRASLDCLDGAVARSCNKQSELGKKLDIILDYVSSVVIAGVIIYMLFVHNTTNYIFTRSISIAIVVGLVALMYGMHRVYTGNITENWFINTIHDNTILVETLKITAAWWIVRV